MQHPNSEADLAEAVATAEGPLAIMGGGTRAYGRPIEGEPISTRALSGVSLYEPGALTMVAQAGTPLSLIAATLAAEGQRLAFEPSDLGPLLATDGPSTIGGVFATNASGPRRVQAGAARDHLLGVRFVDGQGLIIKNGGRVMKNVTGYDLVKLMAGSHGTLGILTEVSFKVLPAPETETTLTFRAADPVALMSDALASPFEISGAATGPLAEDGSGEVCLRLEGFDQSVRYRTDRLQERLRVFGEAVIVGDAGRSAALWASIRDATTFCEHAFVARIGLKPSDLRVLRADLVAMARSCGQDPAALVIRSDWGGGLVWVGVASGDLAGFAVKAQAEDAVPADAGAKALILHLQDWCARNGGHATLLKAPLSVRKTVRSFQPEAPTLAALTRGLRAKFDPRGLFNPGMTD